jgi:hypothetical protein
VGIQDLLDNPNPESPAHAEAYALFKSLHYVLRLIIGRIRHSIKRRFLLRHARELLRSITTRVHTDQGMERGGVDNCIGVVELAVS